MSSFLFCLKWKINQKIWKQRFQNLIWLNHLNSVAISLTKVNWAGSSIKCLLKIYFLFFLFPLCASSLSLSFFSPTNAWFFFFPRALTNRNIFQTKELWITSYYNSVSTYLIDLRRQFQTQFLAVERFNCC